MKNAFPSLLAALSLSAVLGSAAYASTTPDKLDGASMITAEQARDLQAKGVPLIDTRVAAEFAEKTIKGAVNVPYKEKSAKATDFDRKLDSFDMAKLPGSKNTPVVFFCNAGECWKSYKASVVSRDSGYTKIYWLRGGLPEWAAKGLPTQ